MKYSFAFIWPIIKSKRFFTSQLKTLAIICSYRRLISKHNLDMKSSSENFSQYPLRWKNLLSSNGVFICSIDVYTSMEVKVQLGNSFLDHFLCGQVAD